MENIQSKKLERLVVKLGRGYVVLKTGDIDRIESERNYLRLFSGENSFLIRNTLADLEKKLDQDLFVRVNRSTIINIDRIKKIEVDQKYNYLVVMKDNVSVTWGRKFRNNLKKALTN